MKDILIAIFSALIGAILQKRHRGKLLWLLKNEPLKRYSNSQEAIATKTTSIIKSNKIGLNHNFIPPCEIHDTLRPNIPIQNTLCSMVVTIRSQ